MPFPLGKGNLRESHHSDASTLPYGVLATTIIPSATSLIKELAKGILLNMNVEAEWPIQLCSLGSH